ncbi:SpoIIE family protein phosphatase [Streptomyces sp. NPDC002143]
MAHSDPVAIVDRRGIVTGWSEALERLTGYGARDVVGRKAEGFVVGDVPGEVLAALGGVVALQHRDGHVMELALKVCPLLGVAGRPQGFLLMVSEPGVLKPTVAEQVFEQASVGLSAFDTQQRILRLNAKASRGMGLAEEELVGKLLTDLASADIGTRVFLQHQQKVVQTGRSVHFEGYGRLPAGGREHAWNVEMWPVRDERGELVAVGMAAFDSSEQHRARQRLALLNEAATSIGTTLDVMKTAEELVALAVPRFADFASVDLLDWVLGAEEPAPDTEESPDVVMRRVAHRTDVGEVQEAAVPIGETDRYPPFSPPARALAGGHPVLSAAGDPGLDRWITEHPTRAAMAREHEPRGVVARSLLAAPLQARGTTLGVAVFVRAVCPDPYTADDVALAQELTSRAAVCVDNARRFARERSTALTLQHSLLPQQPPGKAAVEVAHRYLPTGSVAGVGGDWFDVIPLSGSRVALVVGDVVGHGIHSAATMGRLRTAVRTLADVDLPPDELLTHLDDMVIHLAMDRSGGADVAELGATCLYAVYDPASRRFTVASAGHPPPVVSLPDHMAEVVTLAAGPPLGVGGLPFESTELELPEGSLIALYTDGLIESRDRDIDRGTAELCRVLTPSSESLEAACDAVLKSLLPQRPGDDVALLLARTRALGADQVATWELPPDPAQVATARQNATDQLAEWGLEDAAFITELVVSELVTNAIRYGHAPIQLRLIRDRTLICEVSDGSSTSPHLRRAHVYDEGGRGLLLVAQLTQRWGSRQTGLGKTIWAEQTLP